MQTSLAFARKNLDDLNVRAPVAGKVSGFDVEVGESITPFRIPPPITPDSRIGYRIAPTSAKPKRASASPSSSRSEGGEPPP